MANVGDKYIIEITEKGMLGDYYAGTIRLTEREVDKIEKFDLVGEAVYDKGYKDGLEKAWEIAKRILIPAYEKTYSRYELEVMFGKDIKMFGFTNMTVFEVMDKVDLYEKKKSRKGQNQRR